MISACINCSVALEYNPSAYPMIASQCEEGQKIGEKCQRYNLKVRN
jgi:hypothetical protein